MSGIFTDSSSCCLVRGGKSSCFHGLARGGSEPRCRGFQKSSSPDAGAAKLEAWMDVIRLGPDLLLSMPLFQVVCGGTSRIAFSTEVQGRGTGQARDPMALRWHRVHMAFFGLDGGLNSIGMSLAGRPLRRGSVGRRPAMSKAAGSAVMGMTARSNNHRQSERREIGDASPRSGPRTGPLHRRLQSLLSERRGFRPGRRGDTSLNLEEIHPRRIEAGCAAASTLRFPGPRNWSSALKFDLSGQAGRVRLRAGRASSTSACRGRSQS